MRAARLLEKMSLDEKLTLMHGELGDAYDVNQAGHVCGIPRLGIPEVFIADGEYGVDILWETTALPAKVSLAATFDEKSAYEYGSVLGRESKDTGIHMVLSTRVNIARDPIAQIGQSNGGNFQTLGEDPLLNGVLGCAEVKGIQQDNNALANVKHFFGSSTGTAQGAGNSVMDEQTAFDLYLLPFEMVIRAGAATLMSSYNQVNGVWTYRHTDILRKFVSERWGFHGIMVCDWCCLYSSAAAAGGVTLEMPEENYYGKKLRQAIRTPDSGVTEADIDQCVLRYLDTLDRFGMLDEKRIPGSLSVETKAAHIPIARRLASRGAVLLKNENQILPLNAARDQIVFIGPTAAAVAMPVFKEGSYGFSDRKQSPLEAMRELSGRAIAFEQGTDMEGELIPATNWQDLQHTRIRYETDPMNDRDLKTLPTPLQVFEIDEQLSFQDESTLPALGGPDEYYMFNGFITAEETGWHRLSLQVEIPTLADHDKNGITNKDMFCFTSGNLYIKEESTYRCIGIGTRTAMNGGIVPNSDVVPCRDGWNNAAGFVYLEAGRKYEIAATATNLYRGPVSARLCWSKPSYRAECRKRAVEAAAKADVAVVFVWHKSPSDAMELKEEQNELIAQVAAANPRTVVVINSGDPIVMPWLNDVGAVLEMWFPGQEGGYATADILLGHCDPGGRLPVTFPRKLTDTVAHAPGHPERCAPSGKVAQDNYVSENVARFTEGVHVGYRWMQQQGIAPLFPFGYGLSYTTFEMLELQAARRAEGGADVTLVIRNTGSREGICVPQLYLQAPEKIPKGVQLPVKALAGFQSVLLQPDEEKRIEMNVAMEAFSYWDVHIHDRHVLEDKRKLWAGFSSEDLPLYVEV